MELYFHFFHTRGCGSFWLRTKKIQNKKKEKKGRSVLMILILKKFNKQKAIQKS